MANSLEIRKGIPEVNSFKGFMKNNGEYIFLFLLLVFIITITSIFENVSFEDKFKFLGVVLLATFSLIKIKLLVFKRYYRVIKRLKYEEDKDIPVIYIVQSYTSLRGIKKIIGAKNLNWKDIRDFSSYSDEEKNKLSALQYFDSKTIPRTFEYEVLSKVRMAKKKLSIEHALGIFFRSWWVLSTVFSLVLVVCLIQFLGNLQSNDIRYTSITCAIIACISYILLYKIKLNRFFRIIKITETQGRKKSVTFKIQSFITYKSNTKFCSKKEVNQKSKFYKYANNTTLDGAECDFNSLTKEDIIIEEVL